MEYQSNAILDKLPNHLRQYIKPQCYEEYSSINQAVWRYVMRQNIHVLPQIAHESYVEGLRKTGISIDYIPNMYGMNRILKDIGWAAVAVDGFIPPQAFMEFQAYNVLVIASEIRTIEHILYTPAPDILHEGAGHAPIIANPEYAEYLRRFGEIGSKALSSAEDVLLYEAVRALSIIKEAPGASIQAIHKAEQHVLDVQSQMGPPSEMAQIRNLHWWTVEYGLIGSLDNPKIYGAGLLSSIGESQSCLQSKVKKLPYGLEVSQQGFDITKPQPQLYVTPDFAHLSFVLETFADSMALRTGGKAGIQKLINSQQLGTIGLSTGLQISGHCCSMQVYNDQPIYIQMKGPTALAYENRELVGHGVLSHADGFGTPIGKLKDIDLSIEDMRPEDLRRYNIYEGETIALEFEGGVIVQGEVITGTRNIQGKITLIKFKNCTVSLGKEILFKPEWGVYDMAVGKSVLSVFAGPADINSFDRTSHRVSTFGQVPHADATVSALENLYTKVRTLREKKAPTTKTICQILQEIQALKHPDGWLAVLELVELAHSHTLSQAETACRDYLEAKVKEHPHFQPLVKDGLALL